MISALLQTLLARGVMGLSEEGLDRVGLQGASFRGRDRALGGAVVLPLRVSYRDLEQMMGERGVSVDHSTIYRWVVLVQFAHCPILARIRRV